MNFDAETLKKLRFFVNNGEIYDFTYGDLIQSGDILEYCLVEETLQSALLSVRLTEPVPVRFPLSPISPPSLTFP